MRFDSQFCRMNCHMFSWLLSSGARGGNGRGAGGDLGGDLVEMKLHGFAVAPRQHEGGAGATIGADRTEQVARLGALIMGGAGA